VSASRALVLGAAGQLGRACMDCAPEAIAVWGVSRASCDVTDDVALRRVMDEVDPHIVINAAAYTAVDAAEEDRDMAEAVNAEAPAHFYLILARFIFELVRIKFTIVFTAAKIACRDLPNCVTTTCFMIF
jgi:dTDP-4-dehydrorhamnose reductase